MQVSGVFPFGQELRMVEQQDRTRKDVFVLGVYASAVHARWADGQNKTIVQALAAASEPYIFWKGDNASGIIDSIQIPKELGTLTSAGELFNGPSGKALDDLFLSPMGYDRSQAWLCDLVPHCCLNTGQIVAIERRYNPLAQEYGLPKVTIPPRPKRFSDDKRVNEILAEIEQAQPKLIVLLGDEPIKWFLSRFDDRYRRLSDFGDYGHIHRLRLRDRVNSVLPLVHPRQAAKLGAHSRQWHEAHQTWVRHEASHVRDVVAENSG